MKYFFAALFILLLSREGQAQSRYVVRFRDKGSNPFSLASPLNYLSQRALDRRTRYSIALDSTDLPVTPRYVDSVRLAGAVIILNVSKWLNSVSIQTTDAAALSKINSLPFVIGVSQIAERRASTFPKNDLEEGNDFPGMRANGVSSNFFSYGSSLDQIHMHNGEFLHNIGLRGQTMVIGMLDAGFKNYLSVPAFDSVRLNGQILGTWDFVAREASVNEDDTHGEECFSIIAANIPNTMVGTAPKASFYLFRSEDASSEYPIEEHNWVCAAERVDSAGGDLISSSLGYGYEFDNQAYDNTYAQMDGNTTMAAIGADLAAKKGILVANSAGNEGNSAWHYILTPADADSVLAVGAVDRNGTPAGFSSYGPSSDGQVKPDVASLGVSTYVYNPGNFVASGDGTSFACPNMLGLATCLWQGFPEFNNMRIINALRRAGSKYTTPDDRVGYGIPDMKKALSFLLKDFAHTTATLANCRTTLNWTSKDMSAMRYEIERKLPGETSFSQIAQQSGSGSVFGTRSAYQYQDPLTGVPTGTISYRVRQVIDTSAAGLSFIYTDTSTVTLSATCTATGISTVPISSAGISINPNPVSDRATLHVTTAAPVARLVIRIVNAKGQVTGMQERSKGAGAASFDIDMARLSAGKYFVSVYDGQQLLGTKELVRL